MATNDDYNRAWTALEAVQADLDACLEQRGLQQLEIDRLIDNDDFHNQHAFQLHRRIANLRSLLARERYWHRLFKEAFRRADQVVALAVKQQQSPRVNDVACEQCRADVGEMCLDRGYQPPRRASEPCQPRFFALVSRLRGNHE